MKLKIKVPGKITKFNRVYKETSKAIRKCCNGLCDAFIQKGTELNIYDFSYLNHSGAYCKHTHFCSVCEKLVREKYCDEKVYEQYRFKTEKEFFNEFGEEWRNEISDGWSDDMNYLFGHNITEYIYNEVVNVGYSKVDSWRIDLDCLTKNPLPKDVVDEPEMDFDSIKVVISQKLLERKSFIKLNIEDEISLRI